MELVPAVVKGGDALLPAVRCEPCRVPSPPHTHPPTALHAPPPARRAPCPLPQAPHKVNLDKPQKTILVNVLKATCGVAVVEQFRELCRFNIRTLAIPEEERERQKAEQQAQQKAAQAGDVAAKQQEQQKAGEGEPVADAAAAEEPKAAAEAPQEGQAEQQQEGEQAEQQEVAAAEAT